jgi:hypothetical protein
MDKEEELRNIFGQLRGGSLEDVAAKLMAFFRAPEWWEEAFDEQFVVRGSMGAFQDAEKRDAVKAFISALLRRVIHEERQKFVMDIERIRETFLAGVGSPEEQRKARQLYAFLLHAIRHKFDLPQEKLAGVCSSSLAKKGQGRL